MSHALPFPAPRCQVPRRHVFSSRLFCSFWKLLTTTITSVSECWESSLVPFLHPVGCNFLSRNPFSLCLCGRPSCAVYSGSALALCHCLWSLWPTSCCQSPEAVWGFIFCFQSRLEYLVLHDMFAVLHDMFAVLLPPSLFFFLPEAGSHCPAQVVLELVILLP